MASIITDLRENFRRGNIAVRLIYINVAVFVVTGLLQVVLTLFNRSVAGLFHWVELPASVERFLWQPWSLLTYMFMHDGLLHVLFNMLWLYWFGGLFLQFFSARHLRGVYLLGGVCGGLLYLLAFNLFPYFRPYVYGAFLLGASASVLGVVTAAAYRAPNYQLQLFLFGSVRLKYLALVVVGLDLLFVTSGNGGGHIAHLGGALAGVWFAHALGRGRDVTAWINGLADSVAGLFSHRARKPKMKVHKTHAASGRRQEYDYNARKKAASDEVDRILDKLKQSGYASLTEEEKRTLFDASRR